MQRDSVTSCYPCLSTMGRRLITHAPVSISMCTDMTAVWDERVGTVTTEAQTRACLMEVTRGPGAYHNVMFPDSPRLTIV